MILRRSSKGVDIGICIEKTHLEFFSQSETRASVNHVMMSSEWNVVWDGQTADRVVGDGGLKHGGHVIFCRIPIPIAISMWAAAGDWGTRGVARGWRMWGGVRRRQCRWELAVPSIKHDTRLISFFNDLDLPLFFTFFNPTFFS